jgi:hypothetical protein
MGPRVGLDTVVERGEVNSYFLVVEFIVYPD